MSADIRLLPQLSAAGASSVPGVEFRDLRLLAFNVGPDPAPNFIVELMFGSDFTLKELPPELIARGSRDVRFGQHDAVLTCYQVQWWPRPALFREARGQPVFARPVPLEVRIGPRLFLWRTRVPSAEGRAEMWHLRTDNRTSQTAFERMKPDDWEIFESEHDPDPPS